MEYLLLIFRKWPETETYWLINRPGLPVSRTSPLIQNTPADPILIPDLLASLTETLTSDLAAYIGYQFTNTWSTTTTTTGPESTDSFVLLERHNSTNNTEPQPQTQDREANADAENNTQSPKRSHPHRTRPGSVNCTSRDMSRINEGLSAEEICDPFCVCMRE